MDHDTYILEQAAQIVYERPEQHGEPEDTFNSIARFWNAHLASIGIPNNPLDAVDVAKMFIEMKIARSNEGHYDEDNPIDVAGYAENWGRLEENQKRELEYKEADTTGVKRGVLHSYKLGIISEDERDEILEKL